MDNSELAEDDEKISDLVAIHNIVDHGEIVMAPSPSNYQLNRTNVIYCRSNNTTTKGSSQSNSSSIQEIITSNEITIRELETNESSISGALRSCKKMILRPYMKLLGVIGIKPLCNDTADLCTCSIIVNKIYLMVIIVLLLSGYILQYLTCLRRDRGFAYKEDKGTGPLTSNLTQTQLESSSSSSKSVEEPAYTSCKGNAVYVHLFPNLLHFGSFLYMVYLYRFHHDEQLPNLLERVFIHSSKANTASYSHKRLGRTLRLVVFCSIGWILLSLVCQVTQITQCLYSVEVLYWRRITTLWKYTFVFIMAISNMWQDMIQVAVIASYCVHCYLLRTYLTLIESRIQHHSLSLADCIKEVGEIDRLVNYVNFQLGPAVGLLIGLDTIYTVSSAAFILDKGYNMGYINLLTVALQGITWLIILWCPLFRAAKLSSACKRLKGLGHSVRMRPFGYQNTPQTDLDSFLLFISTLRMNVHIFRIPISAALLSICIGTTCLSLLTWGLFFV